jgi:hypothetical protein
MFSKEIKKIVWLVFLLMISFSVVTYVGNVLIIGEKIGRVTYPLVEIIIDVLFILGPITAVIWKIRKDVLKYKFVCFDEITADNVSREKIYDFLNGVKENSHQEEISSNLKLAYQAIAITDKKKYVKNYLEECDNKSAAAVRQMTILAALSVVVSHKSVVDTLGMFFWNFRIINKVLEIYGVRPSLLALIQIYCNVLFSSMLVGSIEEVMDHFDTPDINIPFLSPLTQAVSTVYACLKTEKLTKYYLQHGLASDRKNAISEARKYALKSLPGLLYDDFFQEKVKIIYTSGKDYIGDKVKLFWEKFKTQKDVN